MIRKFLVISFVISLFIIFAQTETSAQTRVKFKRGATSGKIIGRLQPNENRNFVLSAYEGQEIRVKVISKNGRVKVEGEGGPTENVFDAVAGNNVIRIYNNGKYRSSFTAVFTVSDIVNIAPKEIFFEKGKSSKTIKSTIGGNLGRAFILGAKKGQTITAKIISKENRVIINEEEGATSLTLDATDGANRIDIINKSKYRSSYSINFSIRDKKLSPPIRINFERGKSSKTIDLVMNAYQKSKKFVVGAGKGQTINIDIETKDAMERIAMNLDNAVDNEDDWLDGFGYLMVTTGRTGDYVFEVIKLDEKYLSAKMKISIKSDN